MRKVHQFQYGLFGLIALGVIALAYVWWRKRQRIRFFRERLQQSRAARRAAKELKKKK